MSRRDVALSTLIGREVRDAEGRVIGRLEEVRAEVAPDDPGEYVVREYEVGHYGVLGLIAGGRFTRQFLLRLPRLFGCQRIVVPWEQMDLTDPACPTIRGNDGTMATA